MTRLGLGIGDNKLTGIIKKLKADTFQYLQNQLENLDGLFNEIVSVGTISYWIMVFLVAC